MVDLLRSYIKNNRKDGVWRCPSDPSQKIEQDGEFRVSYSINAWFEYGAPLAQVEKPAEKVYLLESADDHFHWWEMGHPEQTFPILPLDKLPQDELNKQVAMLRHSDGANYLYADGHVKWSHFAPLWGTTRDTNAFWP